MENINEDISLMIDGMGIVFYSPGLVTAIPMESDFLGDEFTNPSDVSRHIKKGDITGFCTGSPGIFELKFRSGYPDKIIDREFPVSIRLGIQVIGGEIRIIDLFWLSEFNPECPNDQIIAVEDGFYHITLNTRKPKSGIWGDKQVIFVYLNKLPHMPDLAWTGVPYLFSE